MRKKQREDPAISAYRLFVIRHCKEQMVLLGRAAAIMQPIADRDDKDGESIRAAMEVVRNVIAHSAFTIKEYEREARRG
jgi:hypothetical protein